LLTLDRFVTVERTGWDDCKGNAHPNHGSSLQNYDLKLGRKLNFDELFSDPARARAVVRAEILATASAQGEGGWFSEERGSEEYRRWLDGGEYDFSFDERGLTVLTPNLYHADTQLETTVSWEKLLLLIKPNGPLGGYRAWMRHQIPYESLPASPAGR
jgi:hypothetical protein